MTPSNAAIARRARSWSAVACVDDGRAGSDESIREYMSGNLCRCGAYPKIVAAIRDAARKTERG